REKSLLESTLILSSPLLATYSSPRLRLAKLRLIQMDPANLITLVRLKTVL
ncbi:hypothetical protein CSPAE12_04878, partial [Colletotrichum incanum]